MLEWQCSGDGVELRSAVGVEEEVGSDGAGTHHGVHILRGHQLDLVVVTLQPVLLILPAAPTPARLV